MVKKEDLSQATVSLTKRCNLNCIWCFERSDQFQTDFLNLEQIKSIFDKFHDYGIKSINLTGGEPLIRPDIADVLHYAFDKFENVNMTSNGLLIDENNSKMFKNENFRITISVDGSKKIHEKIRGKGTFDRLLEKIRILKNNNLRFAIQTTVSQLNLDQIDFLVGFAKEYNAEMLSFSRMKSVGRGKLFSKFSLTPQQNKDLAEKIVSLSEKGEKIRYKESLMCILRPEMIELSRKHPHAVLGGCRAGFESIYIDHDGSIFPCPLIPIKIGDILKDDLAEVWLGSRVLKDLRQKSKYSKCSKCDYWNICRGCRAEALALHGDYLSEDNGCWVQ